MRKVTLSTRVHSIELNAHDWELFADKPGVDAAAESLNERFKELVNSGATRKETDRAMFVFMGKLGQFGACDSEPGWVLDDLLDTVYGTEKRESVTANDFVNSVFYAENFNRAEE